jgi:hypothetical protein
MNCFDTWNSPVRRIPEWGTAAGMNGISSERYGAANYLAVSEQIMKNQADFAADWMDILIGHSDKVTLFQWDGYSDSNTFNTSKGCHLWVNSGITGRSGSFEKYSFFAVIGAPARDKLKKAIANGPTSDDAAEFASYPTAWADYSKSIATAEELLDKRIYTLEGVNEVKDATAELTAAIQRLERLNTTFTYGDEIAASIVAGETLNVAVEMANTDATAQTIIAALYTEAGVPVNVASGNGTIAGDLINFNLELEIPEDVPSGAYVKIFIWKNNVFEPVRKVIIFSDEGVTVN